MTLSNCSMVMSHCEVLWLRLEGSNEIIMKRKLGLLGVFKNVSSWFIIINVCINVVLNCQGHGWSWTIPWCQSIKHNIMTYKNFICRMHTLVVLLLWWVSYKTEPFQLRIKTGLCFTQDMHMWNESKQFLMEEVWCTSIQVLVRSDHVSSCHWGLVFLWA